MRVFVLFIACGVTLGCGNAPIDEPSEEAVKDVQSDTAALSFREQCDTLPADASLPATGDSVWSPAYYTRSGCTKAFLVDVELGGAQTGRVYVGWAAEPPTTQAECGNASLLSYVWDITTPTSVQFEARSEWGVWAPASGQDPAHCITPFYFSRPPGGRHYRYAVSARQVNGNGSYGTRSLVVSNL